MVLLFHEPLYFRHLHTIRFSRGEGLRQRFLIKLTMPSAAIYWVVLPHMPKELAPFHGTEYGGEAYVQLIYLEKKETNIDLA